MKTKFYISAFTVSLLVSQSFAQNETDALRYSLQGFGGSARYNGMAGAFGALGGDLSCMVTNPAGLGRFTKSEFNFGLMFEDVSSSTSFLGTTTNDGKGNFNLGHIGLVGTKQLDGADWKYMQFGMAFNRTNYLHNSIVLSGDNNLSSIADVFRGNANGTLPEELANVYPNSADLAYQAYIIDPADTLSGTTVYTDRVPDGITVSQKRDILRRGNLSEMSFTFSGNYRDKLYVGATFGIPSARFEEDWIHTESLNDPDSLTSLSSFSYYQTLNTRGVGFNLKAGLIFLPVDWLRIGAAVHTPNYYSFNDSWNNRVTSAFEDGDSYDITGPLSNYAWRMRTPAKAMGSVGVILFKRAAINVDVEYVDYKAMRLKRDWSDMSGYNFSSENANIDNSFTSAVNIRAGAEVRLKPIFIRGGYALNQTPYISGLTKTDGTTKVIAAGLGYRNNGFSADLGVNIINYGEDIYPYDPVLFNGQPAEVSTSIVRTTLTFGWRF